MNDLARLIEGYHRFRDTAFEDQRARWTALSEGQTARVMVIACSDSRVDPTRIFDTRPGEIFVVRNVAALVPPFEDSPGLHGVSAALEYAVQFLKVSDIIVLGHGRCGGCDAALRQTMKDQPPGRGGFIADWIALLDEARARVAATHGDLDSAEAQHAMELEAVRTSLRNLRSFPCVRELEPAGRLRLTGGWFAITTGRLHLLDEAGGRFEPV